MSAEVRVAIQSTDGLFLSAENGGGGALHANRPAQGPWEIFTLIDTDNTKTHIGSGDFVFIRSYDGHYVDAENGGGGGTNANRTQPGPWETFKIFLLNETPAGFFPTAGTIPYGTHVPVAFTASNGNWVTAENGGGGDVNANRPAIGPWEHFTIRTDVI